MENIGVIGAGTIGVGVAQNFAQNGYKVTLIDISEDALKSAVKRIKDGMLLYNILNKTKKSVEKAKILENIKLSTDYNTLNDSIFVVENVTEKWDIKREVYKKIDAICSENCIFGANTSAISITKIGGFTKRPDKIIGIHFMNPVPLMDTVEVIQGYHTSESTIEKTQNILKSIGKDFIIAKDFPGFVSNRISHLFMNEAAFVVQDQVANPEDVDAIFKKCFKHKMGPLETADLIGLDTIVNTLDVLYESYKDPKYRCCPLLRKMVDAGMYGVKSGQGFYKYER